jgi:hypothetical protein
MKSFVSGKKNEFRKQKKGEQDLSKITPRSNFESPMKRETFRTGKEHTSVISDLDKEDS